MGFWEGLGGLWEGLLALFSNILRHGNDFDENLDFGGILEGSGEALGAVLGGFWDAFGRLLGVSWALLGALRTLFGTVFCKFWVVLAFWANFW